MGKKILKKKIIGLCIVVFVGIIGAIGYYYWSMPAIEFQSHIQLEINGDLKPEDYITKLSNCEIKDIQIDTTQVDVNNLGTYTITYTLQDEMYNVDVQIVDTQAPTFDIKEKTYLLGSEFDVQDLVKNVKDDTQTKVYFKEDYDFSQAGDIKIVIVVEDEAQNKTEKETIVHIVEDKEKPTLTGVKDITVIQNGQVDYLKGIKAKDNFDSNPEITVESSSVQLSKPGTYPITYIVKDQSGNKKTYQAQVTVKEKKKIKTIGQSGDKVVYLTFDDGPSANTEKILVILNKYNVKATFFVTGNGKSYNYLIKKAYSQGHTIGLHSYTHNYSIYKSEETYFQDLDKIGNMVKNQIGFVPKYIRFPGGSSNAVSKKYKKGIMSILVGEVQDRGYQYYDWNVSSGDASGNNVSVSTIVKNSTSSHANNVMILLHDTKAKNTTVQALPKIIEHYQSLGYRFEGITDKSFTCHHNVNN